MRALHGKTGAGTEGLERWTRTDLQNITVIASGNQPITHLPSGLRNNPSDKPSSGQDAQSAVQEDGYEALFLSRAVEAPSSPPQPFSGIMKLSHPLSLFPFLPQAG